MESADTIREAVAAVERLRGDVAGTPGLAHALGQLKRLQNRRFAGTYADLLAQPLYAPAASFFLAELYGDADYSARDTQFARIASSIESFFPDEVAATAVGLARLHALSEQLDHALALHWLGAGEADPELRRYVAAWRAVGRRGDRMAQLELMRGVGTQLARHTRKPGLRLALRMMRGPAQAARLGALQRFLESGFDTFGALARQPGGAELFLETVATRERDWIDRLFDADLVACETELARTLGQAR